MDCKEFMLQVWTLMDAEPDERAWASLRAHLENCPLCQRHYRFETVLRVHVRQSCAEPAPELLRRRIRRFIAELGDA